MGVVEEEVEVRVRVKGCEWVGLYMMKRGKGERLVRSKGDKK